MHIMQVNYPWGGGGKVSFLGHNLLNCSFSGPYPGGGGGGGGGVQGVHLQINDYCYAFEN